MRSALVVPELQHPEEFRHVVLSVQFEAESIPCRFQRFQVPREASFAFGSESSKPDGFALQTRLYARSEHYRLALAAFRAIPGATGDPHAFDFD